MSQEASPKLKCPARPPPPDPSKLRTLRLTTFTHSEEEQAETCNLSSESQNLPTYIDVLSDKPSAKKSVAPARPPPPVWKGSSLSQRAKASDLNGHAETSDMRYTETSWGNGSGDSTVDGPGYTDVLPNERRLTNPTTPENAAPPRPVAPPRLSVTQPRKVFLCQSRSIEPSQHLYESIEEILSQGEDGESADLARKASDLNGDAETSDIRYPETSWGNGSGDSTEDGPGYTDVLPNERRLTNPTTPENAAPPRPVAPPRLSVTQPRKVFLCQSRSIEPSQHLYESIEEILSQGEDGESAGLARKRRPATFHSWSKQSSMNEDNTSTELYILLEWWRCIGGLESLQMDNQGEERVTKPLVSVAQRVKTAMRLYELLLVQRCTDLLNHITELHCTADSLVKSSKKTRVAKLTGGTTGAVGGVTIAAGLALAPLTFGASLVATGVGIGIVAAGGVAGASASLTKKMKVTQLKEKVEKIINSYQSQIEDILACLRFIEIGMEHLRKQEDTKLKEMGAHLEKIGRVAQEMESVNSTDVIRECFGTLQDLDFYFIEEDNSGTKKNSNSRLAKKVYEVADKLKECMDQLIRIKKLFCSVDDDV